MATADRLRPHPQDRFSAPAQVLDLPRTAQELRSEPHPAVDGHRQIALFRRGPVTLVQFVFEPGGLLPEHSAEGVVTIHTLAGRLVVVADDEAHTLGPGQVLALAPGVPHTVRAEIASEMLLTVHRMADVG
jgi:quercetin dioxygenase-like cupin family protein